MPRLPNNNEEPLGVVGLGLMGTALAERFLEHGYSVVVWNRTRSKADPLLARGAVWGDNPLAICRRVVISLYTAEVVRDVMEPWWGILRPGQIVVDTTTAEPSAVVPLGDRFAAHGVQYLDAPISGSSEQTRRGEATVMVGGDAGAFEACADLWPVMGCRVFHLGPCGSAATMKLITNLVLGLNRAALAEGLAFAEGLGVPLAAALEVMRGSMAYSKAMDGKGPKMVAGDYSVQARLSQHLKDVRLMLKASAEAGLTLPLTETHRQLMERAERDGLGDRDNSVVFETLRHPQWRGRKPR